VKLGQPVPLSNLSRELNELTDLPDIWRVKEAESRPRETVLGNHRRQSQQSRLEFRGRLRRDILADERSGLLTHTATTESVSLCTPTNS